MKCVAPFVAINPSRLPNGNWGLPPQRYPITPSARKYLPAEDKARVIRHISHAAGAVGRTKAIGLEEVCCQPYPSQGVCHQANVYVEKHLLLGINA